ncbi:DUF3427 domain-containing protein [Bacillus massiliigorillae]|uniref:DUF3427 domain-containing protein n=1 Tax=Bacillus massiliigorillae TaxID=1243664 RepID=UPI00039E5617|nr:DUF3427 domain-containing protein [Bacillus massiliigorillae]
MHTREGFYEELLLKNKDYPENQLVQKITPKEYVEVLILDTAKKLDEKYSELAVSENYDEIIELTQRVNQLLSGKSDSFKLPLSMITYSTENEIPAMEDLYLTRLGLLHNEKNSVKNFFKTLKYEMRTADAVDFMVSFTRMSGLQLIIRALKELEERGVPVRIITSTYMGITEAKALRKLLEFKNVDVRVIDTQKESFHTKAYSFHRVSDLNTVIIGSSNLSHSALINGHELNVKIPDTSYLPIYEETKRIFENTWNSEQAYSLTSDFIEKYELTQERKRESNPELMLIKDKNDEYDVEVKPNFMQRKALENLQYTRDLGNNKGVVIAATGTGKTYLAAFDVKAFNPKKLLFLAHREELLDNAVNTFKKVIKKDELFGKITGSVKEYEKPFVFSTVQTLHKEHSLTKFSQDEFDYIIIDEFHHAEASTYLKIIEYFNPKFLLGITATPERMDGRDVLALCDHNIVYEIRLRDALEAKLLVPFHYFGVTDETIDYNLIPIKNGLLDEDALVKALNTNERTDYIIEMINRYGFHGDKMIALGFCANIKHAQYMTDEFNKRGIKAACLTGNDSVSYREEIVSRLEDTHNPLEIIFTVNIFNEGIDIPKVNLILFLRPTESSTIFIQQLGRGLRKVEGKEFVTILDFIGNYQKSFIVPLALSGQINHKAFDKDSLRVAITHEFADLPGGSYVDLDPVSQKQILDKIDSIKMDATEMLKALYQQFKNELGRSPEIMDFLYSEESPSLTFFIHKYKSWANTKDAMNDSNEFEQSILSNQLKKEVVERLEQQIPLKWPYEMIILELAIKKDCVSLDDVIKRLEERFATKISRSHHESFINRSFESLSNLERNQKWMFGYVDRELFILNNEIKELLREEEYRKYILERIEYGIIDYRRTFKVKLLSLNENLTLYQNYTRNDIQFLSGSTAKKGTWREGVSRVGNHYFLFVNLNKSEDVSEHLLYKDYFIDQSHFHWQSQNKTSHASTVGQDYINHKEKGIKIHLFARKFNKMHGITLPFTYFGELDYVSSHGDKPMSIKWKLQHPVPEDLFIDLIR